jgi:hypothetical protein
MVNDEGAQVNEGVRTEDGTSHYYCSRPLGKAEGTSPASVSSKNDSKNRCSPDNQCPSCANFTPDPTLTPKQAQWLESRKSLHGRTEPFQLTNLHLKPKKQKQAFLVIISPFFENGIMTAIVANTLLMACHSFPQPTEWWDEFKAALGYTFAFIFFVEFCLKIFALRNNYWKDPWNLFDFFCVIATFVGIVLNLLGVGLGAVMSVIRIFRVARLFRLLRFMKGVNKIFMALVYSLPKLANVCILLVLLLCLYGILGVQLFAQNQFSDTLDLHGNFQNFPRAFITLFRAMTGEAWNEMMHDLAKNEQDFLNKESWCSPAGLWDTEKAETFRILKDKCMIDYPNKCPEYPTITKFYFVTFCLIITFMVLNIVIAVILEGYEDGKEHTEGEVIDACITVWKKYDPDYTMFIPFQEAFRYSDEVLHKITNGVEDEELKTPEIRMSPTCSFGVDFACIPMKYAQAFDMQMTEDGQVHFIPVVKLVLRFMHSNNDPEMLKEIEETDTKLSKKDKDKLQRMESKQLMKNNAVLQEGTSLPAQVAASKIQRRFKARQARRAAKNDIERRFSGSQSSPVGAYPSQDNPRDETDGLVAESVSSTPGRAPEGTLSAEAAGTTAAASASTGPLPNGLQPRSPANVDGLDEPGRWTMVNVSPAESGAATAGGNNGQADRAPTSGMVLNPPPGG